MRTIYFYLIAFWLLVAFSSCDSCEKKAVKTSAGFDQMNITWQGDSIGSLFLEKSYVLLPFYFGDIEDTLVVRFCIDYDGCFLFYEKISKEIEQSKNLDLLQDEIYNYNYLGNLSGCIGQHTFIDKNIIVKSNYGSELDQIAGIIDLSFFDNKILGINFAEDNIQVYWSAEDIPFYSDLSFYEFSIHNGKVFLPVVINNHQYNFKLVSESAVYALFDTSKITDSILKTEIGGEQYEDPALFPTDESLLADIKTDGIIGSVFFKNKILFLDLENRMFAIKKIER